MRLLKGFSLLIRVASSVKFSYHFLIKLSPKNALLAEVT